MVRTGLQRWLTEGPACAGLGDSPRYGLVAHPATIDTAGRHVLEIAGSSAPGLPTRLFAPEHGLWGREQDMESVGEVVDPWTGIPVISLYGEDASSLRPSAETLEGLDAVVVDLQDIGSRYYTFIYTMAYVMEAAAPTGLPVVVLDRPNPIGGMRVEGPVLEPGWESFVGRYPLPVRHGMTAGELARWFNDTQDIGCDLRVVEMTGWERSMEFERTGLPWVPPSPNMPAVRTARVYPGGCLIEGTRLSEGRGTTLPFELVGSPTLDARSLAGRLREREAPGVAFRATAFRPMFQKHTGETCHGVHVIVTDDATFQPFETYLAILAVARESAGDDFAWRTEAYEFEVDRLAIDLLCGTDWIRAGLESGVEVRELTQRWQPGLDRFRREREAFLLYR
ncbi:MAG: DUF1343 domain-containing protein [Acidobacteria bacterium]|nr:DUF1343 domain-containing protein [Acidobacteriota bacterium]NIM64077.1 DUF1343 domain-containing protein [Acidobacteriota bacterium]NIO60973.1 DUF1343 domain-containing protein [Acidobacteriota bacterium]NIQ31989.1 DUF1343 domain-containing protein [Acidobacteriota bacterium]NIQ87485.1 DUF1343 domain-containing protein [Acidobacteriota bacterium]